MTFEENDRGFMVEREEAVAAMESETTDLFESQGVHYFSGYLCKVLRRFHNGKECAVCDAHCGKITEKTNVIAEEELFTFLKRFDNEESTLYAASDDFVCFVKRACFLTHHCLKKYLVSSAIQSSLKKAVLNHVPETNPPFCTVEMRERISGHIVKTLLMYHLKRLNDTLKQNDEKRSNRKLRILKNQ